MNENNNHNSPAALPPPAAPYPSNAVTWYPEEYEEGVSLRDYWYVLKKRKWWVAGNNGRGCNHRQFSVIPFMSPIWEGEITLQITQDRGSAALGSAGSSMDPLGALTGSSDLDRFYDTQYAILKSPAMAYGLIDALKLQDHPSYKKMIKENPD